MEAELEQLRKENASLRAQLDETSSPPTKGNSDSRKFGSAGLTSAQIERYSRQSILDDFRPAGTAALLQGRVLIVGAGGLGSSAAMYLATAGVGYLRIVDHDTVERSNLHRQIIHTDRRCGEPKCQSAKKMLLELNPSITIEAIQDSLRVENAMELLEGIDVVLDATDNVAARYLINDACVVAKVPLVSGAAIRWEGQLTVYGYTNTTSEAASQGACYRCMFPKPPPPAAVGSCSDTGVVGAVPGTIGILQAIEVQKILMQRGDVMSGRMLLFNALQATFRTIKMRGRQKDCAVCGDNPTITKAGTFHSESTAVGAFNEYTFGVCAVQLPPAKQLHHSITCTELQERVVAGSSKETSTGAAPVQILLDVRAPVQHELCTLIPRDSVAVINVDGKKLQSDLDATSQPPLGQGTNPSALEQLVETIQGARGKRNRGEHEHGEGEDATNGPPPVDVFVFCRRGILSHKSVEALQALQEGESAPPACAPGAKQVLQNVTFHDVKGGLSAWARQVDEGFPSY